MKTGFVDFLIREENGSDCRVSYVPYTIWLSRTTRIKVLTGKMTVKPRTCGIVHRVWR